jgi:hypothetical protein
LLLYLSDQWSFTDTGKGKGKGKVTP